MQTNPEKTPYEDLAVTPESNYGGYRIIVRKYQDRISFDIAGQNDLVITPTGVSVFGTIANWTYGTKYVKGVIRNSDGSKYVFALFGIGNDGVVYIVAPDAYPEGLYPNCMSITDTILL